MDVHIPAAITTTLRRRGIDVLTAQDDGSTEIDDAELLQRATALERVLFTQHQDFLRIAAEWQRDRMTFHGIVCAPQLGSSIGQIIDDLELLMTVANEAELNGQIIHLPLK